MGSKFFRKGENSDAALYNEKGGLLESLHSENDKSFAIIIKCGHCGNGYYIPILLSCYAKNIKTAIKNIKAMPRVKRDYKYAVIDAFEVTDKENYMIKSINDHDPYLLGYDKEDDEKILARRIPTSLRIKSILEDNLDATDSELKSLIETVDSFDEKYVIQRYYAPRIQGGKVTYLKRFDRKEFLEEYFTRETYRLGIRKSDIHFLSVYYQIYGENNKLGLKYNNGYFSFRTKEGKLYSRAVNDLSESLIEEADALREASNPKKSNQPEFFSGREIKRESATDKFNRRMAKFNNKSSSEEQNSGPQMI